MEDNVPNRINPFPILVNSTIVHPPPTKGRFQHIAFCFMPQFPFVLLGLGVYLGGYWLLLPALFLVLLVPLMDMITGWQDSGHFQKANFSRSQLFLLHWNTRLYAIFYVAAVLWLAKSLNRFSGAETGFLVFSLSLIGGVCFAAAHELLDAKEKLDQLLQRLTTAFLFYPHYKLIHIQSHHSHASTTHDKNTAWLDESIYSYLLRTVPESMLRCWQIEAARFLNRQSFWARIFHNQMSTYALGQIALLAGLYLWPGWAGLLFYLSQVIGAHLVLESVNYIQHYGLMRKEHEGQYEKTGAEHSWDTYHYFSSYATFRVGHHSYHHIAVKPYYLLSTEAAAPKLPVGYFWAIPMVFIPQWWRRVINPKLEPAAAGVQSAVALQVLR
jgi:alkane 1-monooxygenase